MKLTPLSSAKFNVAVSLDTVVLAQVQEYFNLLAPELFFKF